MSRSYLFCCLLQTFSSFTAFVDNAVIHVTCNLSDRNGIWHNSRGAAVRFPIGIAETNLIVDELILENRKPLYRYKTKH